MKAVTLHAAKDLRIDDRHLGEPGPGQVLIQLKAGGVCGSDLHYYNHGGIGDIKLSEPMVLGHEVAGLVQRLGPEVETLKIGQLVAVSPSRPCGACKFCADAKQNHCLNMRFYGSAMVKPHVQGAFRECLIVDVNQCAVAKGLQPEIAAMAEPLAVVLHAVSIAGDLSGRRVLVTGCGPIGLLAVLVARAAGAAEVVATDISDFTLSIAAKLGADLALNVSCQPAALAKYHDGKGHFDILFECSGAPSVLGSAVVALRPQATIVQLGLGGNMTLPLQQLTAKELVLKGSFRFHDEFASAVEMLQSGHLDVSPLVTHLFPMKDAVKAFELASDRSKAIKVSLSF